MKTLFQSLVTFTLSWTLSLTNVFAADLPKPKLQAEIEATYTFALDIESLRAGQVHYFSDLIVAPQSPLSNKGFTLALGMDYPRYWETKGTDTYSVMFGRAAFTLNQPISYFSRDKALDVQRLNRLMPEFPLKKLGTQPGRFRSTSAPGCSVFIETFTQNEIRQQGLARPELRFPERIHPELGIPDFLVLQNNSDFDRIFGFRTSQGAITLSAHYALDSTQTLILVYSLGYLHNLPPAIWGGEKLVLDSSRDATLVLVERMRKE